MGLLGFIDDELLAKVKAIQIRARHLVSDVFAGEYQSAFKGRGLEFEEVREYLPGDDVRAIDWNVTARTGRPFIKTFRDERELTVVFAVDVSASSRFGTLAKFKNEVAAEIAALLAYTALRNNDKVGLVIFSDHIEHYIPPKKGRGHIWRIIREILSYQSTARATDLMVPVDFLNRVIHRRAVAFLLSDFQDDSAGGGARWREGLRAVARRHDLIAIQIQDLRELELPAIGFLELEDAETGETILIDTSDKALRDEYALNARQARAETLHFFRSAGIDLIHVNTHEPYIDPIARFFRTRETR
jgi:uncharacterized protein (DUF58 family)